MRVLHQQTWFAILKMVGGEKVVKEKEKYILHNYVKRERASVLGKMYGKL